VLGRPDHFLLSTYFYYAKYRMRPGFDVSKLDGKLTFRDGLLVESTSVSF
jgi:hypothetical protein